MLCEVTTVISKREAYRLTLMKAMAAAQTRIAEHIEGFYGAADRTSEGAIASHAYKQSVAELDTVIGRELVSQVALCVARLKFDLDG